MTRLRLLLLLGGLGALLTGSAYACPSTGPDPDAKPVPAHSAAALRILERAAAVARTTTWSGTQSIVSTRGSEPRFTMLRVQHTPGMGSAVDLLAQDDHDLAPDLLDDKLFSLLVSNYNVAIAGETLCDGRSAYLIEALRPGTTGVGAIAGKFWVDQATGMVLRRDVLDEDGAVVVSSSLTDLVVSQVSPIGLTKAVPPVDGEKLEAGDIAELIEDGWPIVDHLPAGMEMFEAIRHDEVVQLAYSDGLSTLSLFVQEGSLPASTRGLTREVGGALVHVTGTGPEQLVWAGGGRTWTLVSDASDTTIGEAVLVLPHADPPAGDEGMASRVWRGMSRVGSWLNPFD